MIIACGACHQKNRVRAADLDREIRCGKCKAPIAPLAHPLEADPEIFDDVIGSSPLPVLVDFWAAWCGPCRVAAPHVARVAERTAGRAVVLKVDTERHPELAARYRVEGIPNFVVFRAGRVAHQHAGVVPADTMIGWLVPY